MRQKQQEMKPKLENNFLKKLQRDDGLWLNVLS